MAYIHLGMPGSRWRHEKGRLYSYDQIARDASRSAGLSVAIVCPGGMGRSLIAASELLDGWLSGR
jgi:hypothetical protein